MKEKVTYSSAAEIARIAGRLPKYAKLIWLLMKDPNLTAKERLALIAAAGYSISPIDAVPGVIPVIGQLDDLAVLLFAVRWVLSTMPKERADAYLSESGLSMEVVEADFAFVKRTGVRILKKLAAFLGAAAIAVIGFCSTKKNLPTKPR
jgi:uncharacterized membrane protein YkvA (DUF1232 family)